MISTIQFIHFHLSWEDFFQPGPSRMNAYSGTRLKITISGEDLGEELPGWYRAIKYLAPGYFFQSKYSGVQKGMVVPHRLSKTGVLLPGWKMCSLHHLITRWRWHTGEKDANGGEKKASTNFLISQRIPLFLGGQDQLLSSTFQNSCLE